MSRYEEQKHNLSLKLKDICRPYPPLESRIVKTAPSSLTAFENHRRNANTEAAKKAALAVVEEWDDVATITPKLNAPPDGLNSCSPLVTFEEAFMHFKNTDLSQHMGNIQPKLERRGLSAVMNIFFGPPRLYANLEDERDIIFAIAQCQLEWDSPLHEGILQTIYKKLTGSKVDCPRNGCHWQDVGFQGSDPSTDVRGVGMLGILQFLFLATSPTMEMFAKDVYCVARSEKQNFPLAVMSMNLTKIALDSLRKGLLNRECNQQGNIIKVLNEFYSAIFCHTFLIWTRENKTIVDAGYILKDAERFCGQNVSKALRNLHVHLASYSISSNGSNSMEPAMKRAKHCTDEAGLKFVQEFHNVAS